MPIGLRGEEAEEGEKEEEEEEEEEASESGSEDFQESFQELHVSLVYILPKRHLTSTQLDVLN